MKKLLATLCITVFLGGCSTPAELYETNTNSTEETLSTTVTSSVTMVSSYTEAPSTTVKQNATEATVTEKTPTTTARSTLAVTSAIVEPPNEPLVADISARVREPIHNPTATNSEQVGNAPGQPVRIDTFDEIVRFVLNPEIIIQEQRESVRTTFDDGLFNRFIKSIKTRGYILEPRINEQTVKLEHYEERHPIMLNSDDSSGNPSYAVRIRIGNTRVSLHVNFVDEVYFRTASRDPIRFWFGYDRLKHSDMNTPSDRTAVGRIARVARQERLVDALERDGVREGRLVFFHDGYMIDMWVFPDSDLTIWQVAEMLSFERLPIR
jgi:hypothetical protein